MKVVITNFPQGKKIMAIKGIRAATGMGLKEAKDVGDRVEVGNHQTIEVPDADSLRELDEMGVVYTKAEVTVVWEDFVEILGRFPAGMTIGELGAVLRPVADLAALSEEKP